MLTLTETSTTALNTSYLCHNKKSSTVTSIDESYSSPMAQINNFTFQSSASRSSDNSSSLRIDNAV